MRTQTRSGFTIIEVMLFLAVTGALTVGILVGTGAAIGQRRYADSVNSFKGLIQEQYGHTANVINGKANNPTCSRSDDTVLFDEDDQQARGTSECLIMGRFLLIDGHTVTAYSLIGQPDPDAADDSDAAALSNYALAIESPEEYEVSWGAKIVQPDSTDTLASLLIVRSPLSGTILTYVQDGDRRLALTGMINETNMAEKNFCVDSGGGTVLADRLAVRVNARAANQSAIEIPLEKDGVCG